MSNTATGRDGSNPGFEYELETTLMGAYSVFKTETIKRMEDAQAFKSAIATFMNTITGNLDGLISKLSCTWIKSSIDNSMNSLCYAFAAPLFWFGFYMGMVGCMGCCIIPSTYYLRIEFGTEKAWEGVKVQD